MIHKVLLVTTLMLMLVVGMWLGNRSAQNSSQVSIGDSEGSVAELSGEFDRFWDDDIYMILASLQQTGGGSNQQQVNRETGRRAGGPQRRRSWTEIIATDELLAFLKEHEPRMAKSLEWERKNNEKQFNSRVEAYKEVYGPVMQQMRRDPEGGKLSVKMVRYNFYIPWTVRDVKRFEVGSDQYQSAMKRLRGNVANAFDVIIAQQQHQVKRMEERIKDRSENTQQQSSSGERGRGGQRGQRGGFNLDEFRREIEKRKKDIQSWRENKDKIVQERIVELLQDHPNFPWGD